MTARLPRSNRSARRRERGFTLIETIIALGLMGVLLSLLFSGMRFSTRVWDTVQTRSAVAQEREAARRVVRRILEGTQPVHGRRGIVLFDGAPDRLRFIGAPPANARRGDRFDLILEQDGDALVLRWRPFVPGTTETEGAEWQSRALAVGISDLSFRYFASLKRRGTPEWHAAWQDRKQRPLLVEMTVKRKAGVELLAVRLRIDPPSER